MQRINKALLIILLSLCFFGNPCTASVTKFWSLLTLNGNYDNFLYTLEPQLRLSSTPNLFNQFLINGSGGYQISNEWQFWLGQALTTTSQDAEPNDLIEYRFWEQLVWQHRFAQFEIRSRTRLEQRKSFDFPDWENRFRERIWFNFPVTEIISLDLSNEIMMNLNNVQWISTNTWDQNRLYFGISQQISTSTILSAGYMNQWIFTSPTQSDKVFLINLQIRL